MMFERIWKIGSVGQYLHSFIFHLFHLRLSKDSHVSRDKMYSYCMKKATNFVVRNMPYVGVPFMLISYYKFYFQTTDLLSLVGGLSALSIPKLRMFSE